MDSGLPAQLQIKQSKSGVHMMASLNVQSQATSRWVFMELGGTNQDHHIIFDFACSHKAPPFNCSTGKVGSKRIAPVLNLKSKFMRALIINYEFSLHHLIHAHEYP